MPKTPRLSASDTSGFQVALHPRRTRELNPTSPVLRTGSHYKKRSVPRYGAAAPATRQLQGLAYRCVIVKARVIKLSPYGLGSAKLHLSYLEREGVNHGEEPAGFFDRDHTELSGKDLPVAYPQEPHQFRLIVSPQDADRLALTDYTRELMSQIETDLGRKLHWHAINHYNTDNPHTHVIIHGLDTHGEEVFIDREYIANGIRNRAAALATQTLGFRREHEIIDSIQREIKAHRVTAMDRQLRDQAVGGKLTLGEVVNHPIARLQRSRMVGRLHTLQQLGLARKLRHNIWQLDPQLHPKLKQLAHLEASTQRLQTLAASLDAPHNGLRVYGPQELPALRGLVLDRGYVDEVSERGYLIIGDQDGVLHHVETPNLVKEAAQVGHVVQLVGTDTDLLKPADRNIHSYAQAHGGYYHAASHAAWAVAHGNVAASKQAAYLHAHQQRLQTLARQKLIEPVQNKSHPPTHWQIPADFRQRLQAAARKQLAKHAPRLQLLHQQRLEEQIHYPGRSWLDTHYHSLQHEHRHFASSTRLHQAAQARANWLQTHGLVIGTSASRAALDDMERQVLSQRIQQQLPQGWLQLHNGESLQGQSMGVVEMPSLRRYAVVANQRTFAFVPWQHSQLPERGQRMVIGVNQQGRAWHKFLTRQRDITRQRGLSR